MSAVLQARVEQKTDTEANWLANPLIILAGECAFVKGPDSITPINFKIGDGTKKFADLPYWINYAANVVVSTVAPGGTLPGAPLTAGKLIVLAAGTYHQTTGGDIVAPAGCFNVAFWSGVSWSLILSIPVAGDLTMYTLKTDFTALKANVDSLLAGNIPADATYNQVLTGNVASSVNGSYLSFNKAFAATGYIKNVSFRLTARSEATQTFFTCSKSGTNFTVKQVFTVNVTTGTGVKTIDVSASLIPVDPGDLIFLVTNTNQVSFYNDGSAPNTLGISTISSHTTAPATGVVYALGQSQATWSLDLQVVVTEVTKILSAKNLVDTISGAPANSVPSIPLVTGLDTKISANTAKLPTDDVYTYNVVGSGPQNSGTSWLGSNVLSDHAGLLTQISINVKTKNEATQTLGVGSISGSNLTIEQVFTVNIVAAGVNTIDTTSLGINVAVGKNIVLFNNTNIIGFYNSGDTVAVRNGIFVAPTHGSPTVGAVVAVNQNPTWQLDLAFKITVVNTAVSTRNIEQSPSSSTTKIVSSAGVLSIKQGAQKGKDTILFNDKFTTISSEYTANSWGLVTGGVSPSATGLTTYLQLTNRPYALAKRKARFEITFGSDSVVLFYTRTIEGNGNQATMFAVDVPASKIRLYNVFNSVTNTMPTELSNANYTFVSGRRYLVEIERKDDTNTIRIIDGLTGLVSADLSDTTLASGRFLDTYCITLASGAIPVLKSLTVSTPAQVMENEIFLGDSITEGMVLGTADWNKAWSYKLLAESSGAISGRPGGAIDAMLKRIESEIAILRPKFVNVLIGTNPGDTVANLTLACNRLIELGCIPLLHSIPWSSTSNSVTVNALVETVKSNLGINGARFDIATSVSYNNSAQDTSLFLGDLTHPNVAGNLNMYYSRKVWCPEVLY